MEFLLTLAFHLELTDFRRSAAVTPVACERAPPTVDLGPPEHCKHVPLPHTRERHVTIAVTSSTNSALISPPPASFWLPGVAQRGQTRPDRGRAFGEERLLLKISIWMPEPNGIAPRPRLV